MNNLIAVPSANDSGLEAPVDAHFGHCAFYTLVSVQNGAIADVKVIPNIPHAEGGCLAPVETLAQHGVNLMVAGGMGPRPLMGFGQAGINVFHKGESVTVNDAVLAAMEGKLTQFSQQFVCGGCSH